GNFPSQKSRVIATSRASSDSPCVNVPFGIRRSSRIVPPRSSVSPSARAADGKSRRPNATNHRRISAVLHQPDSVYAGSMSKKLSIEDLAEQIRKELDVPRQGDVFRAAVEAGYLTARADGGVDDTERGVLVRAVELLS